MSKAAPRKNSNSRFVGTLILIGVGGVALLGYMMSRPSAGVRPVDPNLPPGTAQGYLIGNADAPVQVLEFGDFECPACSQWATLAEPDVRSRLIATGKISFRFYDFPINIHKNTWPASNAAACADDQGKFVEMHDQLYATQDRWNGEAMSDPTKFFRQLADQIGLDGAKWQECFDSQAHYPRIKANLEEGLRRGVGQTPTFVIGSVMVPGAVSFDQFNRYVEDELAKVEAAKGKAPAKSGR